MSMKRTLSKTEVPLQFRYPVLLSFAALIAVPGSWFIETGEIDQEDHDAPQIDMGAPFPLANWMTVFSLFTDLFAIIPQLYVISHAEDDYCTTGTRDFIGLLSVARIFRASFWTWNFV